MSALPVAPLPVGPRAAEPRSPDARARGFVLQVDLGEDADAIPPQELLRAVCTLRELVEEWFPASSTRAMVSASSAADGRTPTGRRGVGTGATGRPAAPQGSLRDRLAAVPDRSLVEVDVPARTARVDGTPVRLAPREFDLLAHLARARGRVVTRAELLETVWGDAAVRGDTRTVDVHVRRLRATPGLEDLVATVHRQGYRIPPGARLRLLDER